VATALELAGEALTAVSAGQVQQDVKAADDCDLVVFGLGAKDSAAETAGVESGVDNFELSVVQAAVGKPTNVQDS
jgi:hypothetical protein